MSGPANGVQASKSRELTLEKGVEQRLLQTAERERLKQLLRDRLIECGWKEEITELARAYVKERGAETVRADDIVAAIKPRGRQRIPDHIKAELLTQLRTFILAGA